MALVNLELVRGVEQTVIVPLRNLMLRGVMPSQISSVEFSAEEFSFKIPEVNPNLPEDTYVPWTISLSAVLVKEGAKFTIPALDYPFSFKYRAVATSSTGISVTLAHGYVSFHDILKVSAPYISGESDGVIVSATGVILLAEKGTLPTGAENTFEIKNLIELTTSSGSGGSGLPEIDGSDGQVLTRSGPGPFQTAFVDSEELKYDTDLTLIYQVSKL